MLAKHYLLGAASLVCSFIVTSANAQEVDGSAAPGASPGTAASTNDEAAEQSSTGIDEILVTARRRQETSQSVPLSVTAIDETLLARSSATDVRALERYTPNLQVQKQIGTVSNAAYYMRGFGIYTSDPFIEPPIAVTIDGVYQPSVYGSAVDLFDTAVVEVLRGPQGTLLGKNAATGAVAISTKRPEMDFGGSAEFTYGSYNRRDLKAGVDIPLLPDVLAVRASGVLRKGGNYIKNNSVPYDESGGYDHTVGRLAILFQPSKSFEAFLTLTKGDSQQPVPGVRGLNTAIAYPPYVPVTAACTVFLICSPTGGPYTTERQDVGPTEDHSFAAALNMKYDAGPVSLASVTGYQTYEQHLRFDADGLVQRMVDVLDNHVKTKFFSQEVRLSSNAGAGLDFGGAIDWVIGGYYLDSSFEQDLSVSFRGNPPTLALAEGNAKSYAVFASVIVNATDKLAFSFGARNTWDRKRRSFVPGGFPLSARKDETAEFAKLTYEATANYKVASDKMVFLRYAKGYRGGGLPALPSGATLNVSTIYAPETVDNFEAGIKSEWFDRRLRVNLSVFLNKYKDLQNNFFGTFTNPSTGTITTFQTINNIASATTKGVELEVVARPTQALNLRATVGYLNFKFDRYFGNIGAGVIDNTPFTTLTLAPAWTVGAGADYHVPINDVGSVTLSANISYRSGYYLGPNGFKNDFFKQEGYALVGLQARFADTADRYSLTVFADNIFDQHYFIQKSNSGNQNLNGVDGEPATIGVRLGVNF